MTDATADKVYSVGEKLEKAALNTLMGMGTVFCVLILISLIIYCFRFIPMLLGGKKKKKEEKTETPAPAAPVVEETLTDDLELVAVISAAIAASEGTTTDSFVVRSIHRRQGSISHIRTISNNYLILQEDFLNEKLYNYRKWKCL